MRHTYLNTPATATYNTISALDYCWNPKVSQVVVNKFSTQQTEAIKINYDVNIFEN